MGRWIAGATALAAVAVVVGLYFFAKPPSRDRRGEAPMPPDITTRPTPLSEGPTPGPGMGAVLQFLDKRDPTREAGRLIVKEMEPLEARRFLLTEPRIFLFLKDGRTAYILADSGRFYMPGRDQPPESGLLEGNGRIKLFAKKSDGSAVNVETDAPLGDLHFNTLTFDMSLGEVSTDDRIYVTSEEIEFAGRGVRAFIDQANERLSRAEVRTGEFLRFIPKAEQARPAAGRAAAGDVTGGGGRPGQPGESRPPTERPSSSPTARADAGQSAPQREPQPLGPESRYHAIFTGEVKVQRDQMVLTADRLDVWARLFGNRLREGAIAPVRMASASTPAQPSAGAQPGSNLTRTPRQPARDAGDSTPMPAASQPQLKTEEAIAAAVEPDAPSVVELSWTGPLTITPAADTPAPLASDDVSLRFTADATGLVRMRDDGTGATGHASVVEYGASSRRLALSGPGPVSVALQSPEVGRVESVRITADLATGIVHIPTPGQARSTDRSQRISWTDQADLKIRIEDDALAGLETAIFQGDVRGADAGATLDTAYLRAEFERLADGSSSLSRVFAEESFEAIAANDQMLRGRRAEVHFRPGRDAAGQSRADPVLLIARGNVEAKRHATLLTASEIEADLQRTGQDTIGVGERAVARGNASFVQSLPGEPRIEAYGHELIARPHDEHLTLIAAPESPAHVSRGGTRISGPHVTLDGRKRTVWVVGPGEFAQRLEARPGDPDAITRVAASWSREMWVDDLEGRVELLGDAAAAAEGPLILDTIAAHRVQLDLTPADRAEPTAAVEPSLGMGDSDSQRLIRAIAEGPAHHGLGEGRARVEIRRYDAQSAARRLERLLHLESDQILLDNLEQTLDAPGAGRLLVVDRREAERLDAGPAADPGAAPGSTLFDWRGDMRMNRAQGRMRMRERVQLVHKPWPEGEIVFLESEDLTAHLRGVGQPHAAPDGDAPRTLHGELLSATAMGAVYLRSARREMVSDRLEYDAQRGVALASASEGNRVTMIDAERGVVHRAARLRWDLEKDEIRIEETEPITAPRR